VKKEREEKGSRSLRKRRKGSKISKEEEGKVKMSLKEEVGKV